eukprot:scaffold129499_cov48-Phaeocystis_antarctica.AAC.1
MPKRSRRRRGRRGGSRSPEPRGACITYATHAAVRRGRRRDSNCDPTLETELDAKAPKYSMRVCVAQLHARTRVAGLIVTSLFRLR